LDCQWWRKLIKNLNFVQSIDIDPVKDIFYGIGLPKNVNEGVLKENKHLVDFIVMVDPLTNQVKLFHDKHAIDRFFD
jgi:hypothetical protein